LCHLPVDSVVAVEVETVQFFHRLLEQQTPAAAAVEALVTEHQAALEFLL
jgi:hypothetical protein